MSLYIIMTVVSLQAAEQSVCKPFYDDIQFWVSQNTFSNGKIFVILS